MVRFEKGERIEGEKIVFYFGKVNTSMVGARHRVSLGLNGEAIALKPLKRAAAGLGIPREYPRIRCQSARGEGDRVSVSDDKVQYGAHRCFEGRIEREAWCEVVVPWT